MYCVPPLYLEVNSMDVAMVLARAYAASHQGIKYKLGKGGMTPGSPTPGSGGLCDCTGFISWCFGMSRKTADHFYVQANGGWIETSAVWKDIGSNAGIFEPADGRVPGAVVVYPDSNGHEGHIGIVVDENRVVHCSSGNSNHYNNAIRVTDFAVFANNHQSRYGWLYGLS